MLSNIANYLRGVNSRGTNDEALMVNAEVGPASLEGSSVCEYSAVDADDDWVLVNKLGGDAHPGTSPECSSLCVPLRRTPSASSLPSSLEESWFVTPPPCFTSTGPVHMETSSLENLLIEHPSMSVYQQRPPATPLEAPCIEIVGCESITTEFDEGSDQQPQELVLRGSMVLVVSEGSPRVGESDCSSGAIATSAPVSSHVETQGHHRVLQLRSAQKVQQKRACQAFRRNQLDRSNKARELNSRNKIQRRSDRMLRHSGANNNRKC